MKMKAPAGATQCTVNGRVYEVVKGHVEVPDRHALHLIPHGYTIAGEATDPEVADEIAKQRKIDQAKKRIDDAVVQLELAKGRGEAAKKAGDEEGLRAAMLEVQRANGELDAARAAVFN